MSPALGGAEAPVHTAPPLPRRRCVRSRPLTHRFPRSAAMLAAGILLVTVALSPSEASAALSPSEASPALSPSKSSATLSPLEADGTAGRLLSEAGSGDPSEAGNGDASEAGKGAASGDTSPPLPPPPPPPPPSSSTPPSPALSPMSRALPGRMTAASASEVRHEVELATGSLQNISLVLASGTLLKLGGEPFVCDAPIDVTIYSASGRAMLDAESRCPHFVLRNGCRLTVQGLTLVNGNNPEVCVCPLRLAADCRMPRCLEIIN